MGCGRTVTAWLLLVGASNAEHVFFEKIQKEAVEGIPTTGLRGACGSVTCTLASNVRFRWRFFNSYLRKLHSIGHPMFQHYGFGAPLKRYDRTHTSNVTITSTSKGDSLQAH